MIFFSDKNVLIKVGQMKGLVQADMEYVVYVSTKFYLFLNYDFYKEFIHVFLQLHWDVVDIQTKIVLILSLVVQHRPVHV